MGDLENKAKKPNGFEETKGLNQKPKKADNDDEDDNDNEDDDDNEDVVDIDRTNKEQQLQKRFIECIGSTNLNAINECISYLDDLPYEVIEVALLKTSEKNGGWKYAKTILQNWLNAGIKTIEQVKAEEIEFKNKDKPPEETPEEKIARRVREMQDLERRRNGTG